MHRIPLIISSLIAIFSFAVLFDFASLPAWLPLPGWLIWVIFILSLLIAVNELLGKPIPHLRWSFLRMLFGMKTLLTEWQVGDGREERVAIEVINKARKGDADDVIRVIDQFAHQDSLLINVGDEKGLFIDDILKRNQPATVLELGCYVGYSCIRMASKLPASSKIYTIEFRQENADIARRIIEHAGLSDRITVVVGTLGDGGKTIKHLERDCGFGKGKLDFVFIDHAKDEYLPDLNRILEQGWLHKGSVVVADNIKFPGAPEYHAHMKQQEGKLWRSKEHESYLEYQKVITDMVLESEYLGD